MIPKNEREEDKAICDAATEGPWEYDPVLDGMIEGPNGGAIASVAHYASMHTILEQKEEYSSADARCIVRARNRLPLYIAAADATEARIAALEGFAEKADTEADSFEEKGDRQSAMRKDDEAFLWRQAAKIMRGEP